MSMMTKAAADVLAERRRQIEVEGWTPDHDDQHGDNSMSIAAACYALADIPALEVQTLKLRDLWLWTGWAASWFKPKTRRSNLVRATALLLAEIERLDRRPQGRCSNEECGWRGALADAVQKDGAYFCPHNGFDTVKPNSEVNGE